MNSKRTKADDVPRPVVARVHDYPAGNAQGAHSHRRAQLAGADQAAVTVTTSAATWVVPSGWAIWLPSMVEHNIEAQSRLNLYSVYLEPEDCVTLPTYPCVVTVPRLLQELIDRARDLPEDYEPEGPDGRLMQVLIDQILELPPAPVSVVIPRSTLLRQIHTALDADPMDPRSLADWARELHVSRRTLTRMFADEVGIGFKSWRTQLKLVRALQRLGTGEGVSVVALDLGYSSPSSFATVFRKYLGTSPSHYFSQT